MVGLKTKSWFSSVNCLGLAFLPVMIALVAAMWYNSLVISPVMPVPYSACRVMFAFALRQGYSPYPPFDSGALIGWYYPPLSIVAYLPATLFSDSTAAVMAGRCLSLLYFFGPFAWVLSLEVRSGRLKLLNACLVFTVFAVLASRMVCLRYSSTEVHADAPALALGCISLGLVGLMRGPGLGWAGYGAITTAVLATWTKQVQVPLLAVPILWASVSSGKRAGLKALGTTLVVSIVTSVVFFSIFGCKDPFFWMFTVMSPPRLEIRDRS